MKTDPSNQNTVNNTKNLVDDLYWIDETQKSFAVVTVRDENNSLVGYSTADTIKIQPPLGYILLKSEGELHEVKIDGELHEVLVYHGVVEQDRTQFIGRGDLFLNIGSFEIKVVEILINGLIARNTDLVEYDLVIFDPIF